MNKKVAFHSNQLCMRGTEIRLFDYADHNEKILNNTSFILSDKNSNLEALDKFKNRFKDRIFLYDNFYDCHEYCYKNNITDIYLTKAGYNDKKIIPKIKNHIHVVFQEKEPHGDNYFYISKWLAKKMGMPREYVPSMINLPRPSGDLKSQLNIDNDKIIIGRHGGYDQFNIGFVYDSIRDVLNIRDDLVFLFINTQPFIDNPNVKFLDASYDLQYKSNFINTCDYMLHARKMGESHGHAICEFLFFDKPVISWKNGKDQNHIHRMGKKGIWYKNKKSLDKILKKIQVNEKPIGYYNSLVSDLSPENVIHKLARKCFRES